MKLRLIEEMKANERLSELYRADSTDAGFRYLVSRFRNRVGPEKPETFGDGFVGLAQAVEAMRRWCSGEEST